jgi:hypothetical protein
MTRNPLEALKSYRMYWIGANVHIPRGDWIHCLDDAQAIECARATLGAEPLEIWQGTRQVERLEPNCPVGNRVKSASKPMLKFAVLHGKGPAKMPPSTAVRPAIVTTRA